MQGLESNSSVTAASRHRAKRARLTWIGAASVLLVSCGSESGGSAVSAEELHTCDILPGTEVSRIAGGSFAASNADVEQNYGESAFSQCTYSLTDPSRRVTVQIRRSGTPLTMSRQADADRERAADDGTGYGIKYAEAMEAGTDISGLGDYAYAFETWGSMNVVVFRDKRFRVHVWTSVGADNKKHVEQMAEAIARSANERL